MINNKSRLPAAALAGLVAGCLLGAPSASAQDASFTVTGMLGVQFTYIDQRSNIPGLDLQRLYPGIIGEANVTYTSPDKRSIVSVVPYAYIDLVDHHRTYIDLREANYQYRSENWSVLVGAHRVYWGVAKSRRLVNVINQIDSTNDIYYGDEYLGQPMLNVNFFGDWGRLEFYATTWFRDRRLPALDFNLPPGVSYDRNGRFETEHGRWTPDFAVRYQNKFGPVDLGVAYFHGTNREPQIGINLSLAGLKLQPFYERMDQLSIDVAWAVGNWVLKGEAIYRFNQGDSFFAGVIGGEYTMRKAWGDIDIGLVGEFNFDRRKERLSLEKLSFTELTLKYSLESIYDHDVFVGFRLGFNDAGDSHMLAGALIDIKDGTTYLSAEASTRLFDAWRIEAKARYALSSEKQGFGPFALVDYTYSWAQLRLMRFF